ncbi:MAG: uracil-DNA glycosylase [Candidatus Omnitrophica bacterium]|nr:uracil-DNA glycosylase [Candidatus Omnitrophota bacterium]MBU4487675.1 uracil-DNA glycosylase [Candidatus Omnitrophota bacterium]MCG2705215.1 uracil-DNA glycosylase [Candidatus Omnitrophota bacterium]
MNSDINWELNEIVESLKAYSELERLSGIEFSVRSASGTSKEKELVLLEKEIAGMSCCQLCHIRTKLVFGSGSPDAKLMFVGEAPGRDEDLQGLPFVGRAGQLLTKIIESIGLKRSEVYICNILKCRPPDNRAPFPTEILACEPYLKRQIEIIKPRIICALGKFASQTLLKSQTTITQLRGKFYDYEGIKLIPTFHPAYLLRNPGDKRLVWEDMKKIKKALDVK